MRMALLWPPPTVMDVVPVSLSSLGGFLQRHAEPHLFDVGAQYQAWLLTSARVNEALSICDAILADRCRAWSEDVAALQHVLAREAVLHADAAATLDGVTSALRDPAAFATIDQDHAQDVLLRASIILSAAHLPAMMLANRTAALMSREHARAADVPALFALLQAHQEHNPALTGRTWEERFARSEHSVFHRFLDEWLAPRLEATRPELICVTLFSFEAPPFGLAMLRWLRRRFPDVPLAVGGPCLTRAWRFSRMNPAFDCFGPLLPEYADAIGVGEGETTIVRLCEAIADDKPFAGLPGVVARDVAGRVVWPDALPAHRYEDLPSPSIATLDLSPYLVPRPALVLPTAHNCNYRCHFCGYNTHEAQTFNEKPHELVIRDMRAAIEQHGIDTFLLGASNHRPVWLRRLAEAVVKAGLEVAWEVQCVLTPGVDATFSSLLRAGGCRKLHFGIESGSASMRERMNKPVALDNDAIVASVAELCRAGVEVVANFIVGHPGEAPADAEATRVLADQLMPFVSELQLTLFYPEPGSWLVLRAAELGLPVRTVSTDGRVGHFEALVKVDAEELVGPTPPVEDAYEQRRALAGRLLGRWGEHFGHVRSGLVSRHNRMLGFGSFLYAARHGLLAVPEVRLPGAPLERSSPLALAFARADGVTCRRISEEVLLSAVHLGDDGEPDARGRIDYALLAFQPGRGSHLCVQLLVADLWERLDGRRSLGEVWRAQFGADPDDDEAALLVEVMQAMLESGLVSLAAPGPRV